MNECSTIRSVLGPAAAPRPPKPPRHEEAIRFRAAVQPKASGTERSHSDPGLTLRGLGRRALPRQPRRERRRAAKRTVLEVASADPETGVAPGVTRSRNMRSRY